MYIMKDYSKNHDFSNWIVCCSSLTMDKMNTTHDNESIGHRVSMNMAINMNYFIQREGRGASPHPMMSLTFLTYDVNKHKSNL